MKYAVVKINKNQFKVLEGKEILVDKLNSKKELNTEVLLVCDDETCKVGTPIVEGAKVVFKVLEDEKGKKIHSSVYKSKSRYRRKRGFRPEYTRLQVEKISF